MQAGLGNGIPYCEVEPRWCVSSPIPQVAGVNAMNRQRLVDIHDWSDEDDAGAQMSIRLDDEVLRYRQKALQNSPSKRQCKGWKEVIAQQALAIVCEQSGDPRKSIIW